MSKQSDEQLRADCGNRLHKKVGSPQWCWQTTSLAETTYHCAKESAQDWQELLEEIEREKPWEKIPYDTPYGDPDIWAKEHFGVESFDDLWPAAIVARLESEEVS